MTEHDAENLIQDSLFLPPEVTEEAEAWASLMEPMDFSNSLTMHSTLAGPHKSSSIPHMQPAPTASTRVLTQDEINSLLGFDDEWEKEEEELRLRKDFEPVRDAWDEYRRLQELYDRFIAIITSDEYIEQQWPELKELKAIIDKRKTEYDLILKLSRE